MARLKNKICGPLGIWPVCLKLLVQSIWYHLAAKLTISCSIDKLIQCDSVSKPCFHKVSGIMDQVIMSLQYSAWWYPFPAILICRCQNMPDMIRSAVYPTNPWRIYSYLFTSTDPTRSPKSIRPLSSFVNITDISFGAFPPFAQTGKLRPFPHLRYRFPHWYSHPSWPPLLLPFPSSQPVLLHAYKAASRPPWAWFFCFHE